MNIGDSNTWMVRTIVPSLYENRWVAESPVPNPRVGQDLDVVLRELFELGECGLEGRIGWDLLVLERNILSPVVNLVALYDPVAVDLGYWTPTNNCKFRNAN
jgi:hypothetical protein